MCCPAAMDRPRSAPGTRPSATRRRTTPALSRRPPTRRSSTGLPGTTQGKPIRRARSTASADQRRGPAPEPGSEIGPRRGGPILQRKLRRPRPFPTKDQRERRAQDRPGRKAAPRRRRAAMLVRAASAVCSEADRLDGRDRLSGQQAVRRDGEPAQAIKGTRGLPRREPPATRGQPPKPDLSPIPAGL